MIAEIFNGWLVGGHFVALSCKIRLARFSAKLKFQDRAECGNIYFGNPWALCYIWLDKGGFLKLLVELPRLTRNLDHNLTVYLPHINLSPHYHPPTELCINSTRYGGQGLQSLYNMCYQQLYTDGTQDTIRD